MRARAHSNSEETYSWERGNYHEEKMVIHLALNRGFDVDRLLGFWYILAASIRKRWIHPYFFIGLEL